MKTIPIVFATNDDYSVFCYLAIYSLILHADRDSFYDIRVFVTRVSDRKCDLLESLTNDNVRVTCMDISEFLSGIRLEGSIHLSVETYYRLFIPLVLPEFEKVIYLDSDIIILSDVKDLFEYDINDYPVGAAKDVVCEYLDRHSKEIGNLDCRDTFNAGILLMNTRKFEEERIRDKCLALLQEDFKRDERVLKFADQDALNVVLYRNVLWVDKKWNCQAMYSWRLEDVDDNYRDEYVYNLEHAFIIHYSGEKKPWMYPELPMSDRFWNIAKMSPVLNEIVGEVIGKVREKTKKQNCFDDFRFPYGKIPYKSKVAIYGAGKVGTAFYRQLKLTKYAEVVLWVDKNPDECEKEYHVKRIEELDTKDYDYVIIAILSKKTAREIKKTLLDRGITGGKIIWKDYQI